MDQQEQRSKRRKDKTKTNTKGNFATDFIYYSKILNQKKQTERQESGWIINF